MDNLKKSLIGLAIGIKFRPNFSIEDKLGEILDVFLYEKGSIFGPKFFPRTKNNGVVERVLYNPDTNDSLLINHSNIILDISFSDKLSNSKADDILNTFFSVLTEKVYKVVDIKDISLVGIVNKYGINSEATKNELSNKIKEITFSDLNSFDLSVTKKIFLSETKMKRDICDFENAIVSIVKLPDTPSMIMQIDYQHIYEPKLESIIDIKTKDFINRCNSFNKQMEEWLDK